MYDDLITYDFMSNSMKVDEETFRIYVSSCIC